MAYIVGLAGAYSFRVWPDKPGKIGGLDPAQKTPNPRPRKVYLENFNIQINEKQEIY